jgi:predicted NAD/FAD-binding protein
MARQNLNTGSTANDGTGDTLRTAGTKINENFIELYSQLGGGDSGTSLTTAVRLVDSGLEYVGVTNNSILTHTEGASNIR